RIILWRSRLATISSTTGATAARPRSMMLWPPIFTTLTQGRMAKLGVRSVASWMAASLSDPLTRRRPGSVRMSLEVMSCMRGVPRGEGENLQLEGVLLADGSIEPAEGRCRPIGEGGERFLGGGRRQCGKAGGGALPVEVAPGRALGAPARD